VYFYCKGRQEHNGERVDLFFKPLALLAVRIFDQRCSGILVVRVQFYSTTANSYPANQRAKRGG
jgi:hypothetical protein